MHHPNPEEVDIYLRAGAHALDLFKKLRDLWQAEIQRVFNKIRGDNKRDIFAHAYLQSSVKQVIFIDRSSSGEYRAKQHPFTIDEFRAHVNSLIILGKEFWSALDANRADVSAFADAALSADRNFKTSPQNPDANA